MIQIQDGRRRVVIEGVKPEIDGGRFPIKRTAGDTVVVEADLFADGHDAIAGRVLYRPAARGDWEEVALEPLANDRWRAEFSVAELGRYAYTVEGWVDHFLAWRRDLRKRMQADQDTEMDYLIGAGFIEAASTRATGPDASWLRETAAVLRGSGQQALKRRTGLDDTLDRLMRRYPDRRFATRYERELELVVDPVRARFSAWYELFPRSAAAQPGRHGTLRDVEARLRYIADMGFDVLYLPPIHPIGRHFRKGRNNAPAAKPDEAGSPWAIGTSEGGHKSLHPQLGTLEDFDHLVRRARELGIEIALDIAFQAAPDHPYVREHESWFRKRPDNTIQYAENPPKKYQDIYPFDFESQDWRTLWEELRSVFLFWIGHGVRIFRVDNPHTKPFPFWEWCIGEIKREHPEILFLSEAFTRPKMMYRLAKLGFSQSYTYFPWRNTKHELTTYLTELTQTEVREYLRANQWPNTPDILTEFLQTSGRAGFIQRLILAATLGANYGIYGPAFEQMEHKPREQGSEEYLDSEKYEVRHWQLDRPDSLAELIGLVNRIRRENTALQNDWTLRFHNVSNDEIICYSKRSLDGSNLVLVVV
ncbi:MAG TPA: alpha-1,4-glucan--maltose-1-phosphate maltosyltransferase, partial [Bryobacteraceae bacterium]|nr:alpha-1,4-glucan--maltose-1-phosphate maltosyltransferase [Bryobacteraceae bacterium]